MGFASEAAAGQQGCADLTQGQFAAVLIVS